MPTSAEDRSLASDILFMVARHAAEHPGQAELIRDLAAAALGDTQPYTRHVS